MSRHAALSPRKLNLASTHEAAAIAPCGRDERKAGLRRAHRAYEIYILKFGAHLSSRLARHKDAL